MKFGSLSNAKRLMSIIIMLNGWDIPKISIDTSTIRDYED